MLLEIHVQYQIVYRSKKKNLYSVIKIKMHPFYMLQFIGYFYFPKPHLLEF